MKLDRTFCVHSSFAIILGALSCGSLNTFNFVCGTMSCAKSSLHWSVVRYQVTFKWQSGRGSETSFAESG